MNMINHALELAKKGFHVFPLKTGSKLPRIEGFPEKATRDPKVIGAWWAQWPQANVGISTTRFGDAEHLVVIDVDNKLDKRGDAEIQRIKASQDSLPRTYVQMTPTGGRHIVYRTPKSLTQGVDVLGRGLDIRAKGGYVVGAGSTLSGKAYTAVDAPVAEAPAWLESACGEYKPPAPPLPPDTKINEDAAISRAREYLRSDAPPAVEGDGGDHTAFAVACRVKDLGVSAVTAVDLMLEEYNIRCSPPWAEDELERKVHHAYKYGKNPVGADAPEAQFSSVADESPEGGEGSYLDKINNEFALVFLEGSHVILRETRDHLGRRKLDYMSEPSFRRLFSNKIVQRTKGKAMSYAEVWIDWEKRRQYNGVVFAPGKDETPGYFNLWTGWPLKPLAYADANKLQKAGFEAFLEHARKNVCGNNDSDFNWLMTYLAQMIQTPWNKPQTAVVFKGKKGTGKNALIERFLDILPTGCSLLTADSRYLHSNFNGHMDSLLLMVLDEAIWSGDKQADSKLKFLITTKRMTIERKGREPYTVDNYTRTIIMGNEHWQVPASADERRYAVFNVGDDMRGNNQFFEDMRINLDYNGGNRVLFDYLMRFDLGRADIRRIPMNEGLLEQKILSLSPMAQWLYECLNYGYIVGSETEDEWGGEIPARKCMNAFYRYCRDRSVSGWKEGDYMFKKTLNDILPSATSRIKKSDGKSSLMYLLPPVAEAQAEMQKHLGQIMKWETHEA